MHGLGFCLRECGDSRGQFSSSQREPAPEPAGHTEVDIKQDASGLHMSHPALGAAPRSKEGESHRWEEAT